MISIQRQYAELQKCWMTVCQAVLNKNVFKCLLNTESVLHGKIFKKKQTKLLTKTADLYLSYK